MTGHIVSHLLYLNMKNAFCLLIFPRSDYVSIWEFYYRSVVNAGLSELTAIGFIEIQPRVGAFVADFKRKGTMDTLVAILHYNGGAMKTDEMKSLLEIRLVIETLGIKLATGRIPPDGLNLLRELAEEFGKSHDSVLSAELIFRFHHEICVHSGNTLLPIIFYSFRDLALLLWKRYFDRYGNGSLYENTLDLLRQLERRDTEGAVRVFQSSLKQTIDGEVSIYPEE